MCPVYRYSVRVVDLVTLANVAFALVVVGWGNARFARIFARDEIMEPWRNKIKKRFGYQSLASKWANCVWCLGWWTAIPAFALAWFPVMGLRMWWLIPAGWFAVAQAAGSLNTVATVGK
jgi:hypothetical protein